MKLWQKTILMLFALIALSAGTIFAYAATIWGTTKTTLKTTYTSVGKPGSETIKATEPLSILLMGVDTGDASRGGDDSWQGNSDSMIVVTLNPKTDTTTMVSMERDTMTNILDANGETTSSQQKMNAAYPFGYNADGINGAAAWSMNTIGQQVGIKPNNFVAINMQGLISLVNAVGGITVYNDPNNWVATADNAYPEGTIYISDTTDGYDGITIGPGEQLLDGEQALVYARDRHHRANGDYGRIAAQREVITQLMKKLLNMNNLSQYQKFLNNASTDIKTNIQVSDSNLQSLIAYRSCFKKIVSVQYQAIGYTNPADGGSYQLTPDQTLLAVQNLMLKSIDQPTITALDSNVITYDNYIGYAPSSYFLPSVTITEGGKQTVKGVDPDGSIVNITADNAANYVSTSGGAVEAATSSSSAGSSSSAASNE
ncbi:LCP family protein [Lactovum odontotermitis]